MTAGTNAEYDGWQRLNAVKSMVGLEFTIHPHLSAVLSRDHFDGLGSVVALSDAAGDTVQTYEYNIYGQVAASDPNIPNPYLFTGRRFDTETGLYYYRARYYNPYIGRFMQTDPVGYSEGLNLYTYCGNNPLNCIDPSGNYEIEINIPLETVWGNASQGEYDNPDQHKEDVSLYLQAAGFMDSFPGIELTSVTYHGNAYNGYYHCIFEVPDDQNIGMVIRMMEGIPVLQVFNGDTGRITPIIDDRLRGMIEEAYESSSTPNMLSGWVYVVIEGVGGTIFGSGWVASLSASSSVASSGPAIMVVGGVIMVGGVVLGVWDAADSIEIPGYFDTDLYIDISEIDDLNAFLKSHGI